jgi:hypothetical protein
MVSGSSGLGRRNLGKDRVLVPGLTFSGGETLKKYLVGGLAAVAMAAPAVALAQTPAPVVTASGKLSSSNAGTKAKPTGVKFTFKAVNSAESQTTVSRIILDMPAGVQLSGKNLDACTFATLSARGPAGCKSSSRLGTGVAYAFLVNKANPAPDCVAAQGRLPGCLVFANQFFVGGPRLLSVWLQQTNGNVQQPLQGRISANGRKISIEIPKNLQQPAPGLYSALLELSGSWQRSKTVRGKKYSFVSTTGCTARKWAFRTTFEYVGNPQAPSVSSRSAENSQTCRK